MIPLGLHGRGTGADITNTRWNRHMQPVINPSQDAGALDSSQSWFLDCIDTGTEWRAFYTGANTQTLNYFGQDYTNNDATFMAIKTKSNDVLSGWNKVLDVNGDPKPLFKPSFVGGQFDEWQVWMRTIINDGGGNLRGWFIGDSGSPQFEYRVGYATSTDNGDTWTKLGTTPIFTALLTDGGRGVVCLRVVYDGTNYKMFYSGINANVAGMFIAQSTDGITSWSTTHSNLFANQEMGFASDARYVNGVYYLWMQRTNRMTAGNLGPCEEVVAFSSTDLTTWTNLGVQMIIRGAQEFGIGNHVKAMQKPNGNWFMLNTYYINRTQAFDSLNDTKEPSPATKIADSNDNSFIKNSACTHVYPSYVTFHAPLGYSTQFTEFISNTSGSISPLPAGWTERDHLKLTAGQTVTMPNNGLVINGGNFGIKMRIQTDTTGSKELFRIGNDIILSLEGTRALRIRLSSNGSGYQKDYITTVNITKPVGLDYIDNHMYVAIHWNGTTLRMWNADCVEEFTSGQITKTVDNALTTVNNSGSNILIGASTVMELRSVSVINGTAQELKELDI